jgi:hypothetical protein
MKIKAKLFWIVVVILIPAGLAFLSSCEEYKIVQETVDPGEPVLFQTQIQPIFNDNCITCHKGSRDPDLRDGNSYESLTSDGYVNLPASDSKLYKQIISSSHTSFTTDTEKQLIYNWIDQGALDN